MSTQPWLDAIASKRMTEEMYRVVLERHNGKFPGLVGHQPSKIEVKLELSAMLGADTCSFSGIALDAVVEAAKTVPLDSRMVRDLMPRGGGGWWWFDKPLEIATTEGDRPILALLWSFCVTMTDENMKRCKVEPDDVESALRGERYVRVTWEHGDEEVPFDVMFTTYVRTRSGLLAPSCGWKWKSGETIDELLASTREDYMKRLAPFDEGSWTATKTVEAVHRVSQTWIAAMTWMHQEILDDSPQRFRRTVAGETRSERKKAERFEVRIVQLRKKQIKHDETVHHSDRNYSCQWVVSGHWRNQPHGPSRSLRKLVYVNPYIKGPEDKPLKPVSQKVYAVMR